MDLYLRKLIINNYKSIKNETFLFNKGINVLVGKNNSGKSNIVSALNEVLGDKYTTGSYEDKVFYENEDGKSEKTFKIIAEIDEIDIHDYLLIDNIKKSVGLLDIKDYFDENEFDFNNEWIFCDDDTLKERYPQILSTNGKLFWKKKDELKEILKYAKKLWIYKYINKEDDTNIYNIIIKTDTGPKEGLFSFEYISYFRMFFINSNIKNTLITSLLIPAFRSTETTLKISRWTWYGKLLQNEWNYSCTDKQLDDIKVVSSELRETIGTVYKNMKENINKKLEKSLSLMRVNVDFNMLESKSEDYYKNIHLSVNDGVETPIENKGSGLQSLIMIELFKYYCTVFNQSSLLILEEPELFLHPHAKRMLSDILNDFIDNGKNQIIITSHSEEFIHNVDIDSINVIRKSENGTYKKKINIDNYNNGKELQKLKIELQHKNTEMFFAEKVILVEGEEQILIPEIIKSIYGENILNNNDISIIKVGGKSYFGIYRKVLNDLGIDNYIIADYDIINKGLDELLSEDEKIKVGIIRNKVPNKLKKKSKINKEITSRDWSSLVGILDGIVKNKEYDENLDNIWYGFRNRIHEKQKIEDLDDEFKKEIYSFIEGLYNKKIFIMKNGELEDYYKEDVLKNELKGIDGKGIIAYKIAELASENGIEKYMKLDEYKSILEKILCTSNNKEN